MASTQFIKPAVGALQDLGLNLLGDLGKGLLNVFGFAKGGLVKKPTLGVIGEAGPELVVPLAKIGGEAGLMRLFQSVSELEAANRHGRHGGRHRRGRKGERQSWPRGSRRRKRRRPCGSLFRRWTS